MLIQKKKKKKKRSQCRQQPWENTIQRHLRSSNENSDEDNEQNTRGQLRTPVIASNTATELQVGTERQCHNPSLSFFYGLHSFSEHRVRCSSTPRCGLVSLTQSH